MKSSLNLNKSKCQTDSKSELFKELQWLNNSMRQLNKKNHENLVTAAMKWMLYE